MDELLPLVLVSLPISFLLSFAIGANDVANSFGTSFGSGVLTLRQCCILATIFETLGAILLGQSVSETVRKGIFELQIYDNQETLLAAGYLSALIGSALWNLTATLLRLPVSGTHSILGAILGFHVVANGLNHIKWISLAKVVVSWFVSPLASGLICILGYYFVHKFVIRSKPSRRKRLLLALLPIFFALTFFINSFSILFRGPEFLTPFKGNKLAYILFPLGVSLGIAAIVCILILIFWVPRQRAVIEALGESKGGDSTPTSVRREQLYSSPVKSVMAKSMKMLPTEFNIELNQTLAARARKLSINNDLEGPNDANGQSNGQQAQINGSDNKSPTKKEDEVEEKNTDDAEPNNEIEQEDADTPDVAQVFRSLQILTSCFGSFAHGANDVSNAIGPLIAIYLIYVQGNVYQRGDVPFYLLLFGGSGISVGLWVLGSRVLQTIGKDLTPVTPSSGFTIELTSSLTVLMASKLGFPISTTHCKVGSVVALGWLRKKMILNDRKEVRTNEIEDGNVTQDELPKESDTEDASGVNWKLFLEIGAAWILTLPISAAFSALSFYIITISFPSFTSHDTPFVKP